MSHKIEEDNDPQSGIHMLRVVLTGVKTDPTDVIVEFPGGRIFLTKNRSNANYWAHIEVQKDGRMAFSDGPNGEVVNVRIDTIGPNRIKESTALDFKSPAAYHFALEVKAL